MKKELTMKAVAEIFKLASRIGIKPKDIIGQGADVIKMGISLFNTKVNPELTKFISNKGEIPTKIVEQIKVHLRSLKNVSDNQLELFKVNLKDIVNAKSPVSSSKQLATEIMPHYKETPGAFIKKQTHGTKEYYLNEIQLAYPKHYKNLTGKESTAELKEMIYRLDTEGIPFAKGGIANHFRNK